MSETKLNINLSSLDPTVQHQLNLLLNQYYVYKLQNHLDKEIECLKNISLLVPQNVEVYYYLGLLQMKINQSYEALQSFSKFFQSDQITLDQVFEVADSFSEKLLEDEAIDILKNRLDTYEDNSPELYFKLGKLYSQLNNFEQALECLKESIRFGPMENKYQEEYKHILAQQALKWQSDGINLTKSNPKSYEINLIYGKGLKGMNNIPQAKEQFKKCIEITHSTPAAFIECSDCFLMRNESKEAIKLLEECLEHNENCPQTLFKMGYYYLNYNRNILSCSYFIRSIQNLYLKNNKLGVDLANLIENMYDSCFQLLEQEERKSKNNKQDIQLQNKKYEIVFNMYYIKKSYQTAFREVLQQSPQSDHFFLQVGLIAIINILIDKISIKLSCNKKKQIISYLKVEESSQNQRKISKNQQSKKKKQEQLNSKIKNIFLVKFKDDLNCLGDDKDWFESGLNLSFKWYNEFYSVDNKITSSTNHRYLNKLYDETQTNVDRYFKNLNVSNNEKMAKELFQFNEIRNYFYQLANELTETSKFKIVKMDYYEEILLFDPLNQLVINKLLKMIKVYQYENKPDQANRIQLFLLQSLYNALLKQCKEDFEEEYSIDTLQKIQQKYQNLNIFDNSKNIKIQHLIKDKNQQIIDQLNQYTLNTKNDSLAYYILGNAYMSNKEYDKAKNSYYECLLINPLDVKSLYKYAVALTIQRDIETAAQYLSDVYSQIGLDQDFVKRLSQYLIKLDDFYIFNQYYENNYFFYPLDQLILNLNFKNVRQFAKEFKDKLEAIQKNTKKPIPNDIKIYEECINQVKNHEKCFGFCYFQQFQYYEKQKNFGKWQKVFKYLDKCMEVNPDLYRLIYIENLIKTNRFGQAESIIQEQINIDPQNLYYHEAKVVYLIQLKQFEKCIKYILNLKQTIRNVNIDKQFQGYLVKCYLSMNDQDSAISEYQLQEGKELELLVINIFKELKEFSQSFQYLEFKNNYYILLANSYLSISQTHNLIKAMNRFCINCPQFSNQFPSLNEYKLTKAKEINRVNEIALFDKVLIKKKYKLEKDCLKQSNLNSTIAYFTKYLVKNPLDQRPYFILSDLYQKTFKTDKQLNILREYMKYYPNQFSVMEKINQVNYNEGSKLFNNKMYHRASKYFNDYVQCYNQDNIQQIKQKSQLNEQKKQKQAFKDDTSSLKNNSFNYDNRMDKKIGDFKILYYKIAICLKNVGQNLQALEFFKTLVDLYPEQTECYIQIAQILFSIRKYQPCEKILNKLLQVHPNHPLALLYMGKIKYLERNFEKSLDYFEQSINICDAIPEIYLCLCQVYIKLKNYNYANACYEVIAKSQKLINENKLVFGFISKKLKRYHLAISHLLSATGNNNDDKLYYNLAESYFHINCYPEAQKYYNKIKSSQKHKFRLYQIQNKLKQKIDTINDQYYIQNASNIHFHLALQQFNERRNYEFVLSQLNLGLQADSTNTSCIILKAWYALKVYKNTKLANQILREISKESIKNNILALLLQAKLYLINEKYQLAKSSIKSVLDKEFSNEYAFYLLGLIYLKQNNTSKAIHELSKNKYHYQSKRKLAKLMENAQSYDQAKQYFLEAYSLKSWRYENYQNIAEIEFKIKNYSSSLFFNLKALKQIKKQDYQIYNRIGQTYFELEQYKEAIEFLQKSLLILPEQSQILFMVGQCYYLLNQFGEAEIAYLSSFSLNQKDIECTYQLGIVYKIKGDFENAKNYFNICLQQKSDHVDCLNILGEVYYKENNYPQAVKYFAQCTAIQNDHLSALINQSKIQLKFEKNYEAAIDVLNQIHRLNPKSINCVKSLLKVYIITKKQFEAYNLFQKYQKDLAQYSKLQIKYAEFLFQQKDFESVLKLFETGSDWTFDLTSQQIVASCYYIKKQYVKTEQILQKFIKQKIDDYYFNFLSAMLLIKKGVNKKVIYHLKRCTEISPSQPLPYFFQSLIYFNKKMSLAEQFYQKALENQASNPNEISDIRMVLEGKFQFEKGNFLEGEQQLKECIIKFPNSEIGHYTLGMYYLKINNYVQAQDMFEKLKILEPLPLNSIYFKPLSIPECIQYRLGKAEIVEQEKNIKKALDIVQECLEINPNESSALNKQAQLLHKLGNIFYHNKINGFK